MKKALAIIVCLTLVFTSLGLSGNAADEEKVMPVIFIDGFTGSCLYEDDYMVFPPYYDDVSTDSISKMLVSLIFGLFTGNYSPLIKNAEAAFPMLLDDMKRLTVNPDGSSEHNIRVWSQDAEIMRYRTIFGKTANAIEEETGSENCFMFRHDWRLSLVDAAAQLNAFVEQVIELTGADSVALFSYSQGGQVAATYLKYYGDKGQVGKIVFVNSPIAGTKLAVSALDKKQLSVSLVSIMRLVSFISGAENNYDRLLGLVNLRFLNNALTAVISEELYPVCLYWGGVWDMIPLEDYEQLKAKYLDPTEQKWLIEKSDKYHYEVMANTADIFADAKAKGISVSVLSCIDCGIATNTSINGDSIVDVYGSSGAFAAGFGKELKSGYVPKRTVCNDSGHNHISPDRSVDASCAFLPENTWFVIGQGHCQFDEDEYTVRLLTKLMTSDELQSIYSDSDFPQFRYGTAPQNELYISFGEKDAGYISNGDLSVTVTNTSHSESVKLVSLRAGFGLCSAQINNGAVIEPGESATFALRGCSGFRSNEAVRIKAVFKGSVLKTKELTYTSV